MRERPHASGKYRLLQALVYPYQRGHALIDVIVKAQADFPTATWQDVSFTARYSTHVRTQGSFSIYRLDASHDKAASACGTRVASRPGLSMRPIQFTEYIL